MQLVVKWNLHSFSLSQLACWFVVGFFFFLNIIAYVHVFLTDLPTRREIHMFT